MAPGEWPARIVQHIAGSSTNGDGDIYVDSNGKHWRKLSEPEASYWACGAATCPAILGTIIRGKVY